MAVLPPLNFPRMAAAFRTKSPVEGRPAIVTPAAVARRFDRYCFVAGLHRSGTTLVEHILHARCAAAVLRADVPENEGQHLQDVLPAARDHGGPGRFAFHPAMHATPLAGEAAAAARDRLLRCWTPWMEGAGQALIEKSPPNLIRIPFLRSVFPGARFLIVTRDPRAAAAATGKWSRLGLAEMMYHWHVAYSAALAAAEGRSDCVFLRYEDLCADPEAEIDRVMAALGLAPRPVPLPEEPRFAAVENTNARYIERLPAQIWGPGAWDRLGYFL